MEESNKQPKWQQEINRLRNVIKEKDKEIERLLDKEKWAKEHNEAVANKLETNLERLSNLLITIHDCCLTFSNEMGQQYYGNLQIPTGYTLSAKQGFSSEDCARALGVMQAINVMCEQGARKPGL